MGVDTHSVVEFGTRQTWPLLLVVVVDLGVEVELRDVTASTQVKGLGSAPQTDSSPICLQQCRVGFF